MGVDAVVVDGWRSSVLLTERRGTTTRIARHAYRPLLPHSTHPRTHLMGVPVPRDKDQHAVVRLGRVRQNAADLGGQLVVHVRLLRLAVYLIWVE